MKMNRSEEEFARRNPDLYGEITRRAYNRGIEDILGEQKYSEYLLDRFLAECCNIVPDGGSVGSSFLYGWFVDWLKSRFGVPNVQTMTWFGRQMAMRFDKTKTGGIFRYKGLTIR